MSWSILGRFSYPDKTSYILTIAGLSSTTEHLQSVFAFTLPDFKGKCHRITSLNFSPNSDQLLVSFSSENLYLFDLQVNQKWMLAGIWFEMHDSDVLDVGSRMVRAKKDRAPGREPRRPQEELLLQTPVAETETERGLVGHRTGSQTWEGPGQCICPRWVSF